MTNWQGIGKYLVISSLSVCCWTSAVMAAPSVVKPEVAFKQAFPDVPFDSISESDIKGLYEVVSGQNIFYFYPDKEYLIGMEIYTKDRKNLTAEKRKVLSDKAKAVSENMVKELPLDKAIKIGTGKNIVIEFTDPDCPYCKQASEFFKNRTDVTRYVFFSPFAHPNAIDKVHFILNAKDKEKAYHDMMGSTSSERPAAVDNESVKALAQEHMALARKMGIQGTPNFFVNGHMVVGANIKQIEQYLKEGGSDGAGKGSPAKK